MCIRDWLETRASTDRFVPVPPHHHEDDEMELTASDDNVIDRWENAYEGMRERARTSNVRSAITDEIWHSGFRVTETQCDNHARR